MRAAKLRGWLVRGETRGIAKYTRIMVGEEKRARKGGNRGRE